ncbi:SRPBCC family protein [Daejeonia sp. YH14]|uniref:SRPBCC family protein n=1 Tax=Daejeonia sp. YH14 TaxID=3439042 RepID=UPI003F49238A
MHYNVIIKEKINAPVEKVWKALTDRNLMKGWFFDIPDFELEEHHQFNFFEPGDGKKFHHHCEILQIVPMHKLKYSWSYPEFSKDKTLVKWELEDDDDGTMLTLTHKGLENFEHLGKDFTFDKFEQGWNEIIGTSLKGFLENELVEK